MAKSAYSVAFSVIVTLSVQTLWGQRAAEVPTAVVKPVAPAPTTDQNPGTLVLIENRARLFGDKVDGGGTRYFEVKSSDLVGKTPADVASRLSPSVVTAQQRVKTMDIVVDLEHPLVISATGPVTIGTTTLEGKVKDIEVKTSIILSDVKVVKK